MSVTVAIARRGWSFYLDVVATILMIAVAFAVFWWVWPVSKGTKPLPEAALHETPISLTSVPLRGSPAAPITVLEFADFECPFCGEFLRSVLPLLENEFVATGRVRFGFRSLPLAIHPSAAIAAVGADCARQQDRFWAMHDVLFARPAGVSRETLRQRAADLGLNAEVFDACLGAPASDLLVSDAALAGRLGITSTPTFVIGSSRGSNGMSATRALVGMRSVEDFRRAINDALADALRR